MHRRPAAWDCRWNATWDPSATSGTGIDLLLVREGRAKYYAEQLAALQMGYASKRTRARGRGLVGLRCGKLAAAEAGWLCATCHYANGPLYSLSTCRLHHSRGGCPSGLIVTPDLVWRTRAFA